MVTFIDESGDTGTGNKSARHFGLAAVWFGSSEQADAYMEKVSHLKQSMNIAQDFEFHFTKLSYQQRIKFFGAISDLHFRFTFHFFDKARFNIDMLTKTKIIDSTISGMVRCLTEHYLKCSRNGDKISERVTFDECGDAHYVSLLKAHFHAVSAHSAESEKFIKSVKPGKSKSDTRIQLADMICGGMCRHMEGDNSYYDFFRHNSIGVESVRE